MVCKTEPILPRVSLFDGRFTTRVKPSRGRTTRQVQQLPVFVDAVAFRVGRAQEFS
jgi:hypothetical protein